MMYRMIGYPCDWCGGTLKPHPQFPEVMLICTGDCKRSWERRT